MSLTIVDFEQLSAPQLADATRVLRQALAHVPTGYCEPGVAEAEVAARYCNEREWFGFAALEGAVVVGWIGAIPTYVHGWEIHPLVVDPRRQRRGIGTALLRRLEECAKADDVQTLYLCSDDDYGGTNLFGRDLFPEVLRAAATIEPRGRGHPITFYRRHGYQVVGILPDVNGAGKSDILMAKRLGSTTLP